MLTVTLSISVLICILSSSPIFAGDGEQLPAAAVATPQKLQPVQDSQNSLQADKSSDKTVLEPRINNFVRDILDRLHALDNDIGKLLVNSTSMYAPNDESIVPFHENSNNGAKFTEVLLDLDALQDELGVLLANATRTRQYNMLVRLRPLNNIVYRIRHNLHLMRNSLAAINTVARLEKISNTVLDSTLSAFLQPDVGDEIIDAGNYDINLDNMDDMAAINNATLDSKANSMLNQSTKPSHELTSPPSLTTTSTTTTTTTLKPEIVIKQTNSSSSPPTGRPKTTSKPLGDVKSTTKRTQSLTQKRLTSLKPDTAQAMFAEPEIEID